MPRFALALWLLAFGQLGLPSAVAEETFPPSLGAWQRVEIRRLEAAKLQDLAGAEAPLWREYGATGAEYAIYRQGAQRIAVTVILTRDSTGAYGLFSYLGANKEAVNLAEGARRTANSLVLHQGSACITADVSPGSRPEEFLRTLVRLLPPSPLTSPLPSLLAFLPREGLLANSERYVLGPVALARLALLLPGDWVGFAYGAEAVWGEYHLQGQPARLLLASYPTPQLAAAQFQQFGQWFNLNGTGNPTHRLVFAKRAGPLIGILWGVDSSNIAARLLQQLHHEFAITWSEPTGQPTASDWMLTVRNIFIGTSLLVLYLFLCGLIFAGFRLLMQHYFPGKVFNRRESTELIRLDLSRK